MKYGVTGIIEVDEVVEADSPEEAKSIVSWMYGGFPIDKVDVCELDEDY